MDADVETVVRKPFRENVTNRLSGAWNRLVSYMFEPENGECLAMLRMMFGLLMMIDTMDERGFCRADKRWMEPVKCYFPLFDFIKPLPGRWMCLAYACMFAGVLGVFAGYRYRTSCALYAIPYWYIFLADKSSWNNHSYLFGLLIVIFSVTDAHRNWSMDSFLLRKSRSDTSSSSSSVPRWNYLLLRIQFFVMYFVAGLKKFEPDWLLGYSMMSLGNHHAFAPFRYVFSAEFVDHWIVHVGGFLIDLLSGFGLCLQSTRPLTIVVLLIFHGLNSIMFAIGMFPYVCAAMIPVFCDPATVSRALRAVFETGRHQDDRGDPKSKLAAGELPSSPPPTTIETTDAKEAMDTTKTKEAVEAIETTKTKKVVEAMETTEATDTTTRTTKNVIAACLCLYTVLQLFLPFSHFITQGYNGWRNGLYGYSWDMMVYNIDVAKIQVKVMDHARREQFFLDPNVWTDNSKWALHGDMLLQFAGCVAANMPDRRANMSVRMDVWGSLNGRFHQRLVNPAADLLHVAWSPWSPAHWLLPLMRHLDRWRPWIADARRRAAAAGDEVLFIADFPGMTVTDYYADDGDRNGTTTTVTLAVLEGAVAVREPRSDDEDTVRLVSGEAMEVTDRHAVTTVSATPSCYVYAATTETGGGGGGSSLTAAADGDGGGSRRAGCSDACYAFAFDAVRTAFSALF